jgi:hypothetical protein
VASITASVTVAKIKPTNFRPFRSAMVVLSVCPRFYMTGTWFKMR